MKFVSVFALTLTTAAAFQPAVRPATVSSSALFVSKEEDLELTRKVIQEFAMGDSSSEEEPAAGPKKEKEVAASKDE